MIQVSYNYIFHLARVNVFGRETEIKAIKSTQTHYNSLITICYCHELFLPLL